MTTIVAIPQVIEGTWEEISKQSEKFSGHRVRVTLLPDEELPIHPNAPLLALFAQWEKEDAAMSDEEIERVDAVFDAIEKNGIPRIQLSGKD
jgi:hypothetical protein